MIGEVGFKLIVKLFQDESEKPKVENDVKEESKPTATDAQETDTKAEEQKENDDHEKEKEEKTEVVKDEAIEEIKDLKDIKDGELTSKPPSEQNVPNTEISSGKPAEKITEKGAKTARTINVEEYLVKFKNFSYLHCQWLTEQELTRGDKRINQKIKRFQQKRDKSGNVLDFCDEEPFNPDYVEVDRVLDSSSHTDETTNVRH